MSWLLKSLLRRVYMAPEGVEGSGGGAAPTPAEPPPSVEPTSLDAAADAFFKLDNPEPDGDEADEADDTEGADKKPAKKPAKKAAPEDDGDQAEDGPDAEKTDDEDPSDERDEATDDEDDAQDEVETITVDLDGKRLEIPKGTPKALVDTIKSMAGELKTDYTRKTQEVAQARAKMEERTQATQTLLDQVQRAQQAVVAMAQQVIGQPPPLELAQADPGSYMVQKTLYEQRLAQLQSLSGEGAQLTRAQQQRQEEQQQLQMDQEAQKLVRVMPALASLENRRAFMAEAAQVASRSGFTAEDVATVGDHRMLHMLARLIYAERKLAARDQVGQTVKARLANTPPKVLKPGAASQGKKTPQEESMTQLRKFKTKSAAEVAFLAHMR